MTPPLSCNRQLAALLRQPSLPALIHTPAIPSPFRFSSYASSYHSPSWSSHFSSRTCSPQPFSSRYERSRSWCSPLTRQSFRTPSTFNQQRTNATLARTKRALKIAPHLSFLRKPADPELVHMVFNPPSSEPRDCDTPIKFLPRSDPRRAFSLRALVEASGDDTDSGLTEPVPLPPELRAPTDPRYHLMPGHVDDIRSLRAKDPEYWSVNRLAKRFDCSPFFVSKVAPGDKEHLQRIAAKSKGKQIHWGARRTNAREERQKRWTMLHNGQL